MPTRLIREGINSSARVDLLSAETEVFYRRVLNVVDDYGRFDARPALLIAACYPLRAGSMNPDAVERMLSECATGCLPLIRVYVVGGKRYLEVQDFRQQIRSNRSKYPAPSSADAEQSLNTCSANATQVSGLCTPYPESKTKTVYISSSADEGSTSYPTHDSSDGPLFDPTPSPGENRVSRVGQPIEPEMESRKSKDTREIERWFAEEFWPLYPRKVDKQDALSWCRKHAKSAATQTAIMAGLRRDIEAEFDTEKEFTPHPATYLRKGRWKPEEGGSQSTVNAPRHRLMM